MAMLFRVVTYNIHKGIGGVDRRYRLERVIDTLNHCRADIVCLQEVDVFRHRSGNRDQAHAIARHLEMSHQFHPAWHIEEERFGNAILTRYPMNVVQATGLHHHKSDRSRRSAQDREERPSEPTRQRASGGGWLKTSGRTVPSPPGGSPWPG